MHFYSVQVKEHTSFSSMKARNPLEGDKNAVKNTDDKKEGFFRKGE